MADDDPRDVRPRDVRRHQNLSRIVGDYLDSLNRGETLDPLRILAEHPEQGQEILEELQAFLDLDPDAEPDPLGTLGDYTLRRQVGRGGMGVVYEAWENSIGRPVALKVLPAGIAADRRATARFMREAQAAGQLSHPNVVGVHAMGVYENTPYYSMEYVEGETLAQILARIEDAEPETETPFGKKGCAGYFEQLARAFADVADGLQHAHSKGVVHRDVKPSNLILDGGRDRGGNVHGDHGESGHGRLRILDFGLARLEGQESLTLSGDVMGTPLYMSPEQARRKKIPIDHRTDVYSFGATMYEALTGRPPFRGKDHQDTLSQIIERDPPEPRKLNPRVPGDLATIVLKCLRKDPSDRYGTAEALGQDLRRFVRGDPIEARPQGGLELLLRRLWRQRWKFAAAVCGVLSVLVTAVLIYGYSMNRHAVQRAHYEKAVVTAALRLQGLTLASSRSRGDMNLVDPRLAPTLKYEYPDLFSHSGEGFLAELETSLGEAIERMPGRPEGYYYRAKLRLLSNRISEASDDLEQALEKSPDFVPALFLKSILGGQASEHEFASYPSGTWQESWLKAHQALSRSEWEGATEAFDDLQNLANRGEDTYFGASVEVYLGRGQARLQMQDLSGAVKDFAVACHLWPRALEPALLLAKTYYLWGHVEEAEREFERIHELTHDKGTAAVLIHVLVRFLGGDLEETTAWVNKIPHPVYRECARADWLVYFGYVDEAEEAARKAVELDPQFPWAHVTLASALSGQGRHADAEKALQEALWLDPTHIPAKVRLGEELCAQGKWDSGLPIMREALVDDPSHVWTYTRLGNAYLRLGENEKAVAVLLQGLKVHPGEAFLHNYLGYAYLKLGHYDDCIREQEKALELDSRLFSAPYTLALAYIEKDEPATAVKWFHRSLELGWFRPEPYHYLNAFLAANEAQGCEQELETLFELLDHQLRSAEAHPREHQATEALLLATLRVPTEKNLGRAIELAQAVLNKSSYQEADLVTLLAQALFENGLGDEAIRTLQEAMRLSREMGERKTSLKLAEKLEQLRQTKTSPR